MAMTVTAFQAFAELKHEGGADLTETCNISLTNTEPSASSASNWTDISANDLTAGNGYTAGGNAITTTSSQTGGTYTLAMTADCVFTPSGGSIGPFTYAVLREATSGALIQYWTFDNAPRTLTVGQPLTIQAGTLYTDAPAA